MPTKKSASKKPDEDDIQTLYVCPHCERGFKSKNALNGHLGVCKAKPDEDEDEEEENDPGKDSRGIKLFADEDEEMEDDIKLARRKKVVFDKDEDDDEEDEDDGYKCGACGYSQRKKFIYCPRCGEENEF